MEHKQPRRKRLVLASRSPRRTELLREHGLEHEAIHPGIDDGVLAPTGVRAEQWVSALAYLKARAGTEVIRGSRGAGAEHGGTIVLGADTTCVQETANGAQQYHGTPRNEAEARVMLLAFRNSTHRVVTGVALVDAESGSREMWTDSAVVRVGDLTSGQFEDYLASGEWRGKAGAYNLRERIAAGWPIEFDGDPSTIMGLPMRMLLPHLRRRLAPLADAGVHN